MMNPAKGNTSLLLLSLLLVCPICTSLDTITPNQPLKDGQFLHSNQKTFALGFFSPGSSSHRYVGIWYNQISEQTVAWVANRDTPLKDTSGVLSINGKGNLVLHTQNQTTPIWSTNVSFSISSTNNSMAKLLDIGNLVLVQQDSQRVTWQSFDYPTNTMLPLMKLGLDRRTGLNRFLTSWKSKDDPGIGNHSFRVVQTGYPQTSLYMGQTLLWRMGFWNGVTWSGVPQIASKFFKVISVNNQDESTWMYSIVPNLPTKVIVKMVVDESGIVERSLWQETTWVEYWSAPQELCDKYLNCGPNSYCDPHNEVIFECKCFPGFEPKSSRDCIREKQGVSMCNNGEGFVKLAHTRLPDTSTAHADMSLSMKECEQKCLRNCSCMAYASANGSEGGIGCLTWHGDLVDTRIFPDLGQDLYIRVDAVVLAQYAKKNGLTQKKKTLAILGVSVAVMFLLMVSIVYCFVMKKKKEKRHNTYSYSADSTLQYFEDSPSKRDLDGTRRNSNLPLFDLRTIIAATDNFSIANKLGQGGFGPVYKGLLQNGKEIAVKRLSKFSGQGIEQFKMESALIAKLQHINLVRILGCCIHKEEKMLIYEYLPNKSLDFFIFDETKRSCLDWEKRFEIICGIGRGILYLHQDSRLRIIHRDLKASNVLLDNALNPKISDFGLARIVGGDQIEADTNCIAGTYGYMSPEYAMQGHFSIKSDVYSFGVLLLEIITGKRNGTYHHDGPSSNLIGHVWDLWREDNSMKIVDPLLDETYPANEVSRCIQIGILCVQEQAIDRPTMSTIVFMLGNDTPLPSPKQPAFILKGTYNSTDRSTSAASNSINEITLSKIDGR
ncbi:G-type lectin S-receptor-like serine/threonine-protein kinase At1g11410 isoform X1 [Quercus robur]|uniref:G-type lectin S-receptor-like serine/threonine-protein kinase At1g11410 isoform X1 n=1 Tax=Quercus robur TaxID=38942 RepID=UPI0021639F0D|nr:G-type lectin S-receptor-like serine/threonine-protein kinase At1g11410 isoform X1 [Quercus robur]